jgi:hypothetical protein
MATRANLPIILYAPFTSRAKGQIFQSLQQGLFFQCPLVFFLERARRTEDEVHQHARQIQYGNEQGCKRLH